MDLQEPTNKMSKSLDSPQGTVLVTDEPAAIIKKFKRAVTDSDGEVRYDVEAKPGVSNLLGILAAITGRSAEVVAADYTQYGPLKADCGEAVVELLTPIQARFAELAADPAETSRVLGLGAAKASAVAVPVLDRARAAIGLTPRA
jgi:tryptophanyl-tRNA synthetase